MILSFRALPEKHRRSFLIEAMGSQKREDPDTDSKGEAQLLYLLPESFKPGVFAPISTRLNSSFDWFFSLSQSRQSDPAEYHQNIDGSSEYVFLDTPREGAFVDMATSLHHEQKHTETHHEGNRE